MTAHVASITTPTFDVLSSYGFLSGDQLVLSSTRSSFRPMNK